MFDWISSVVGSHEDHTQDDTVPSENRLINRVENKIIVIFFERTIDSNFFRKF